MWQVHTMDCRSAFKRKDTDPCRSVATWPNLEGVVLSETSQSRKDNPEESTHLRDLERSNSQRQQVE